MMILSTQLPFWTCFFRCDSCISGWEACHLWWPHHPWRCCTSFIGGWFVSSLIWYRFNFSHKMSYVIKDLSIWFLQETCYVLHFVKTTSPQERQLQKKCMKKPPVSCLTPQTGQYEVTPNTVASYLLTGDMFILYQRPCYATGSLIVLQYGYQRLLCR